jgi:sterol desaturase/sphingolipid hydroxylase (fatty acid hydroxylase superfamily)
MIAAALVLKTLISKILIMSGARLWVMATIAVVFIPLERLIPHRSQQRLFRPLLWLDFLHFFVGGLITIVMITLSYRLLSYISGGRTFIWTISGWPAWAQFLFFEAGWTFLGYWVHRLAHVWKPLWRIHSVHESSQELDWLSAFRMHPVEPMIFQFLTILPLYLLGASLPVAIAYKLFAYVMAHIQHANIRLPMGPLVYILPSPNFHRWHHARIVDAKGKKIRTFQNFGEYPIWDILFGTFNVPNEKPEHYGNALDVPDSYLEQLAYPFGLHHIVGRMQHRVKRWVRAEAVGRARERLTPALDRLEGKLARLDMLSSRRIAP